MEGDVIDVMVEATVAIFFYCNEGARYYYNNINVPESFVNPPSIGTLGVSRWCLLMYVLVFSSPSESRVS